MRFTGHSSSVIFAPFEPFCRKGRKISYLILLFLGLCSCSFAADSVQDYLARNISSLTPLRAGDFLHIKVFNNRGVVEIDQDCIISVAGEIDLPILGFVKIAGQNLSELEISLTRTLAAKAYKSPKVAINVIKYVMNDKVFVFGGVKTPGPIDFRDNISVMDVVKISGGFEEAGLAGEYSWVNTSNYLDSRSHMSAYQNSQSLDFLEQTKIKRSGKEITVNLKKLIVDGDISQNKNLVNNDILFIPRRSNIVPKFEESFYILGAVNVPGRYRYRENISVMDAISLSGGLWSPTNIKFASIIRGLKPGEGEKKVKPETIQIDIRKLFLRGDLNQDKLLKANDVLLVSTKQYRNILSDLGKFVDNFLPFFTRMDTTLGYDDSIRRFNDRFLK